ncbi:MAG TPA: AAA family ATPase [Steroidobacteraceae bacterium]
MNLLLITGLPSTGKTTLARQLALRYRTIVIGKDLIKEPLLNVLGSASAGDSRKLSDASFSVLFALAGELLAAGMNFVLEGNFRPGEHEAMLADAAAGARFAQVLCRIDEATRLAQLAPRRSQRHAGHADAERAVIAQRASDGYLALPGERLAFDFSEPTAARRLDAIDRWWRQS